jgi:hypothetical protein
MRHFQRVLLIAQSIDGFQSLFHKLTEQDAVFDIQFFFPLVRLKYPRRPSRLENGKLRIENRAKRAR